LVEADVKASAGLAWVVLASSTTLAQWANVPTAVVPRTPDGEPDLTAPAPRLPDGTPDLSGMWNPPPGAVANLARGRQEEVPFQPWARAVYEERTTGVHWKSDPPANCLPQGLPRLLLAPAPWRIVQTPTVVFFVHEAFNLWWQAFTDGRQFRPHPDVSPTWLGYSTASWERDTLVVESAGFNGKVWLDQLGKPSTEALRVTTRFHRRDFGHLEIRITIDDPEAYTKPWSTAVEATLLPDTQLMEFICLENERDTRPN
jgi:hypothetical protein